MREDGNNTPPALHNARGGVLQNKKTKRTKIAFSSNFSNHGKVNPLNKSPIFDYFNLCNIIKNSPMADNNGEENSKVKDPPSIQYVEVNCTSSSKIRRFSVGTEAGFAVKLINRKIDDDDDDDDGLPMALYIEAVKEGEEPISFGPNSVLMCHGHGWKLQTVTEPQGGARARPSVRRTDKYESSPLSSDDLHSAKGLLPSVIGAGYIAKVVFAFVLLFVLGASFTLALENLPRLLIFINSSM